MGHWVRKRALSLDQNTFAGEKLPEDSGLKIFDPNGESSGSSSAEAAKSAQPTQPSITTATPAVDGALAQPPAKVEEEELDDSDFDAQNLRNMHKTMDENLRLLAMSPWIRVSGEMRAAEEQKISQVCFEKQLTYVCHESASRYCREDSAVARCTLPVTMVVRCRAACALCNQYSFQANIFILSRITIHSYESQCLSWCSYMRLISVQDLVSFVNELVPGFGQVVQKVWDGEADEQALAGGLKEMHDAEIGPLIEAAVAQLCQCTLQLQEDHGAPDARAPVDRKRLVNSVKSLSCAADHFEKMLDQTW